MSLEAETPSFFDSIIRLIEAVIWPFTLLAIMFLFKRQFNQALGRMGSLKADSSGITLTFDKKIEAAKNLLSKINPLAVAKSVGETSILVDTTKQPYEQLMDMKYQLQRNLAEQASSNAVNVESDDISTLCDKLKEVGVISIEKAKLVQAIVDLTSAATPSVTQNQVNEIRTLYQAV